MRISLAALALFALPLLSAQSLSDRRAPSFSLPDADLEQHDLLDYRGKVVALTVLRLGCPHCQAFSKKIEAAQQKYGSTLKALSIVTYQDSLEKVRQYMAENELTTTFLFDCGQVTASYMKATPQNPSFQVPHFFLIDEEGWIREDFGYTPLTRDLFEGDGLDAVLSKYVQSADRAD